MKFPTVSLLAAALSTVLFVSPAHAAVDENTCEITTSPVKTIDCYHQGACFRDKIQLDYLDAVFQCYTIISAAARNQCLADAAKDRNWSLYWVGQLQDSCYRLASFVYAPPDSTKTLNPNDE